MKFEDASVALFRQLYPTDELDEANCAVLLFLFEFGSESVSASITVDWRDPDPSIALSHATNETQGGFLDVFTGSLSSRSTSAVNSEEATSGSLPTVS